MAALVVHLMSPGAASVQQDWDAPDGSVRHHFVSWREIPPTVSSADLVVAHGLAALVVSQTLANVGPGLVYRPTGSARPRRRPWSRRLRASWVVAPSSRAGLANAAALGLDRDRVVVVGDDDRDAWNRLASALVRYEQIDADLVPSRRGSPVGRALARSAAARRATKLRKRQLRATQAAEAEARAAEVAERRAEAEAEARRAEQAAQAEAEEEARRVARAAEAEAEARRAEQAAQEAARQAEEAAEARRAEEAAEARRAEEAAEARRAALAAEAEAAARRAEAEADRAARAPVSDVDALVVDVPAAAEGDEPAPEGREAKVGRRQRRRATRAAKAQASRAASAPVAEVEAPVVEVEAPVAAAEVPAGRRAKGRRRQRRATRAAEAEARRAVSARIAEIEALVVPAPVVDAPEPEAEAPVEERRQAKERRRGRRGRRQADVEARVAEAEAPVAEVETPVAEAPAVEMPVVERPPEPPRIETPVPVPPPLPEPPPAPVPPPLPEPPPVPAPEPPPVVAAPAVVARPDLPRIEPAAPRGRPRMVDTGSVEPTTPGLPWFRYRRMDVPPVSAPGDAPAGSLPGAAGQSGVSSDAHGPAPIDKRAGGNGAGGSGAVGSGAGGNGSGNGAGNAAWPPVGGEPPSGPVTPGPEPEPERTRRGVDFVQSVGSGVGMFIIGMALVAVVVIGAQVKMTREGPFLIPLAGLFFVLAAGRRIVRNHPAEAWVANWLLLGYFVKIGACYFRYFTSTVTYGGGDVSGYDQIGRQFAQAWLTGGRAPVLLNLHETNFIRWFTGVVYFIFGQNLVTGTFVFGLLAFVGSYFWYRATVEAVPIIDKKLYMGFVMFAPSIVFWPAEVGKEALMQLGLGAMALGLAYMLRQQLLTGLVVGVAGGWLVWIVRPHLLAMVAIGAGAAYLAGRTRPREGKKKAGLFSRPLGILIVAFLVAFTIGQGAKFLGLSSFSFSSIQTELNATTASSAQGGSSFNNGGHTLNPINYPQDVLTVLIRPFPWEVGGGLQVVASAEGMILAGLIIFRFESIRIAFRRSRESPYLMFCFVLVALYCIAFSSFANFGLLVRERSLVLPAVLVLVAVDPTFEHRRRAAEAAAARQSASPLGTRVPRDDVTA